MPLLYFNVKAAMDKMLEKVLPTCQGVAFTGDFWTSNSADPYLGMTMHFVDEDFVLHRIMVACKLAEGRHTAVHIASHMDKVVSGIAGLKSTTTRFCLTDNAAAMLAAVPKLTKKLDVGFGCIDHILNLIIKSTNKAVPEIAAAIKECKDFSTRVHHTPLDQQRMRRECWNLRNDSGTAEEVNFKKIITDVDTRWNSTLFLIRSISEMKPALQSLKEGRFEDVDKTDQKFKQMIPTDQTFDIIESIIPIMEKVLLLSEVLSGDDKPTLHQVIPMIYNLDSFLHTKMRSASQNTYQRDYCKAMSSELNRR